MVDLEAKALDEVLEEFHLAFRALVAVPDSLLAARGLGRPHHRILYVIGRRAGTTVGHLIDALAVTKQAVHMPLRELIGQRLVSARSSAADGRQKLLHLTAAGRRFEAALTGHQHQHLRSACAGADEQTVRAWREIMQRIAASGITLPRTAGSAESGYRVNGCASRR